MANIKTWGHMLTINPGYLHNHNLSLVSKGLLTWFLAQSEGEGWDRSQLPELLQTDADLVDAAFQQLIDHRYILITSDNGTDFDFYVSDEPVEDGLYTTDEDESWES